MNSNLGTKIIMFAAKTVNAETVKEYRELGRKIRESRVVPAAAYTATWLPAALCLYFVLESLGKGLENEVPLVVTDPRFDDGEEAGGKLFYGKMLDLLDGINCAYPGKVVMVCAAKGAVHKLVEAVTSGSGATPFELEDGHWLEFDVEGGQVVMIRYL